MGKSDGRRNFLNPIMAIRAFREEATSSDPETPVPLVESDQDVRECLLFVARKAMACTFQVFFTPEQGDEIADVAVEALEMVDQLENQMTVYRSSPITYLNQTAFAEPVRVEKRLFGLLQLGKRLFDETEGAFDMTSGLLTKAWGFFRKEGKVPGEIELADLLDCVGSDRMHLDPETETVRFHTENMELNLGGIGKGFALDRLAEFMHEQGVDDYLIHGGQSSVLARGCRKHADESEKWKVGLCHPIRTDHRIAELILKDRSLGTSGTGRQSFYHQGKRYGHIIDPRNGRPAEGVYSATALAPTAAESDALATAFYVMGPEKSVEFCQQHQQYACLLVCPGKGQSVEVYVEGLDEDELILME